MQSINGDWGTQYGNRIMALNGKGMRLTQKLGGKVENIFWGIFRVPP